MSIPNEEENVPYLSVTVDYIKLNDGQAEKEAIEATEKDDNSVEVEVQRARLMFVDTVKEALVLMKRDLLERAKKLIDDLIESIEGLSNEAKRDERIVALLEDLTGQVSEALSKEEYFKKWGCHYLPSLMRAHQLQQCNNFKDPGIQLYGGKLFQTLRDEVDDIFVKLPPPEPTFPIDQGGGYRSGHGGSSPAPFSGFTFAAPVSMSVYHDHDNPCFDGECLVSMADGTLKKVKHVAKGDSIATTALKSAEVVCVVKTHCYRGKANLVELEGGLLVTPYHPVRKEGKWHFPCTLNEVKERECPAVYSFVLGEGHVMVINGMECVTLGHGFEEDEVVRHPYFGSQRVVEDLKALHGWNEGVVELKTGCMQRDYASGLVCGFAQEKETEKENSAVAVANTAC